MLSLTINNTVIDKYLADYTVEIQKVYNSNADFTAIDGTKHQAYLGDKRVLSVNFEPMSTAQINELFTTIKSTQDSVSITYIDPEKGNNKLSFSCGTLPAASFFESDNGVLYWTIPTVTFEEITDFTSSGGSG